jgi:hypothetical protein
MCIGNYVLAYLVLWLTLTETWRISKRRNFQDQEENGMIILLDRIRWRGCVDVNWMELEQGSYQMVYMTSVLIFRVILTSNLINQEQSSEHRMLRWRSYHIPVYFCCGMKRATEIPLAETISIFIRLRSEALLNHKIKHRPKRITRSISILKGFPHTSE